MRSARMLTSLWSSVATAAADLGIRPIVLQSRGGIRLLAAALFLLVGAISCQRTADTAHHTSNGEKSMHMITNPSVSKADPSLNIPPIDKDIPEDIQTATFALG